MSEKIAAVRWSDIRSYLDIPMLVITLVLFSLGVMAIYSASFSYTADLALSSYVVRQLIWGAISALIYVAVLKIGYKKFIKVAFYLFAITVFLLFLLLLIGKVSKGAQSWFHFGFMRFQPSELGKVVFALVLARVATRFPPTSFRAMLPTLGVALLMTLPILLQPDLGSSLVYLAMLFIVLIVSGAPLRFLLGIVLAGLASLPVAWIILKPYQRMRLLIFMDPSVDPQGAGFNVIQSKIAVGSGGLLGKGFLQGTQGKLHFLPEPHTDFIFSVFSEEFGFIGSATVLILFFFLLWKILSVALYTKDLRAKILTTSICAWFWFQITESVAMSMGLAPITGIPLPLFSYGGSSLMAVAIGLALVQSVVIVSKEDRF